MAENRRGKENRFYFSRGQMVLLGAAFTTASLVIFFLGIYVGKSIEERKVLKKEEPLVKIPIKPGSAEPTAQAPQPPARDEITFNDSLSGAANSLASAEESPRDTQPAEKPRSEPDKRATKEKPAPAKAEAAPVKIAEKKAAPADEPAKPETAASAAKEPGKVWRAQVNAFPDERSAKQIVDRLKNKGYNAYVTEVENKGRTWYRVSVGKYGSRDEVDKMVETLRSKENYPKAFAASK